MVLGRDTASAALERIELGLLPVNNIRIVMVYNSVLKSSDFASHFDNWESIEALPVTLVLVGYD